MLETLGPGIRRLIAPNPSPMTLYGTNTYIIGDRDLVVIDPGPLIDAHLEDILKACEDGQRITKLLVTHSHLDHSPLAKRLADQTNAPIYGFGDSFVGRSPLMTSLAQMGEIGGGEGVDADFKPDVIVKDGTVIPHESDQITALWTPGHFSNHMCFEYRNAMFCGDHVMGWSSSLVSPPDGDLAAFMSSCAALLERPVQHYYPGHGDPIQDGPARVKWLIDHRLAREAQILQQLSKGPATADILAKAIYTDVNLALLPAAARNVLAHLLALYESEQVGASTPLSKATEFYLL